MEAACKANPRDVDLARKASYMYYHAARPAQAVKHFDRLNMLVGFKKNPHTKKLAPTDHGGMIDMYARLDRVEDAQAHCQAVVKKILKKGVAVGLDSDLSTEDTQQFIQSIA